MRHPDPTTAAQQAAAAVARRTGAEKLELLGAAWEGVTRALRKLDPTRPKSAQWRYLQNAGETYATNFLRFSGKSSAPGGVCSNSGCSRGEAEGLLLKHPDREYSTPRERPELVSIFSSYTRPASLTPSEKTILFMRSVEEMSPPEIAKELGWTVKTVSKAISVARRKVREAV